MKALAAERAALDERRAGFQQAVADAQAVLDQPGAGVEDTIAARMRQDAARGALVTIEQQIAELDQRIATEQAQQEHEAAIDRLVALAGEGVMALAELEAARLAAHEAMGPLIERMAVAQQAVQAARTAFIHEGRRIAPGLTALRVGRGLTHADAARYRVELDALLAELEGRGADLRAVTAVWRATEQTEIDRDYLFPVLEPYGEALRIALNAYTMAPNAGTDAIMRSNALLVMEAKTTSKGR